MVDLIIPTVTGREDTLERCLEAYRRNTAPDILNYIVIKDEATCGLAWKKGMEESEAPYVALSCDDLEVTSPLWAGACCQTVDAGYLPSPIVRRPDGTLESCGGDMKAPHCLISTMLENGVAVDFSPVPFMSREQADAIGMHRGHYKTDTYVSHKGRQLGWSTVITHGYEFVHHHSNVKRLRPSRDDDQAYAEAMARD